MRKKMSFPVLLLLSWLLLTAAGPLALSLHPSEIHLERRLEGPSSGFPLGTDELGRDLLSRIVFGSRLSLKLTIVSLSLSLLLGGLLGALAGFKGGVADLAISRLIDLLLALPGILLAILILAFFKRGEFSLVLALTISSWVGYARTARAMARQLRDQSFMEAACLSGGGFLFIFRKHLLPNIFPVLGAQATVGAASIIMAESGLSFLGLGVPPPAPSLGGILTNGCDYLLEAPHIIIFTSISMLSVLWGLYKVADDFRTMKV
ncbi:MAG TPA: ABC transporter permease [Acidobacteriota bacterium]|nr:ABC transporter permease [Acidobacteriota bacterium]HQO19038.1 ABC transporter permease [Acidobacteriota bacterium]HQQ45931.1 ABC transporter permease [Acidobacteriota bacterium]